ncbi:hypothetical protein Bca52824_051379 [Brassica carinata]|uniref:Replication factor A C-terminal domain-containing protein n=1 Tax=Brassica carinata TaxID=52824 RepID=A0A8X7R097_BRACI|nr:hypothetical protein Bca52824_051379 [Brassica carinata]
MNQRTLLSRITPLTKVQGSTVFRQGSSLPSVSTGALRSKKRDRKRPPAWVRRTMANTKLNSLPVENTATSLSSDSTGKRKAENPTNSSADKSTKTQNRPDDSTLKFRLLHFWEARKNVKGGPGILLGIEMLMIDAEGTLAQGFIGQNRRNQYEKELQRGSIYTLTNFYASNSSGSQWSAFSEFEANRDLEGSSRHDVVGHLKLVDGQALHQRPILCTNDDSASRKVMVHLQLKDGPVMNVYLWDEAAESFRLKFDASAATPTVLLVTTVNPKKLGGKLCLSSMSSSRVFLDEEVDPTNEYLAWLVDHEPFRTSFVNPAEVVKAETLTIGEISAFLKRQPAQVAYFDCIATIDDFKLGTEWYYIACKNCQTKLNRGHNIALSKIRNENATAASCNYRVEIIVHDNDEQCTLIILRCWERSHSVKATELIDAYENGGDALSLKFHRHADKEIQIKVAHYNFTSTRLSLTATKIVSPAELPPKNLPLKTPPGTKVENTELAESSGGGASAIDDQKKAKPHSSVVVRSHAEWSLYRWLVQTAQMMIL